MESIHKIGETIKLCSHASVVNSEISNKDCDELARRKKAVISKSRLRRLMDEELNYQEPDWNPE